MEKFRSTKVIDGFSTCFRQWKAEGTHCKLLHGYSIYFHVTFEADTLDDRNWVMDFGFLKRSRTKMTLKMWPGDTTKINVTPDEWFKDTFDHSVVLASDDPYLEIFKVLYRNNVINLKILPKVGCEMFAKLVYEELNKFLVEETYSRVRVVRVECFEHPKNSAIYEEIVKINF